MDGIKLTIFSGGRGNKNLFKAIVESDILINLNVIVNGLDDGASTGEIRRVFDNRSHGISDFLKTITTFSNNEISSKFEIRFPKYSNLKEKLYGIYCLYKLIYKPDSQNFLKELDNLDSAELEQIKCHLENFINYSFNVNEEIIDLSDFKLGNIVFASLLIKNNFNFKNSITSFKSICNTPDYVDIIENSIHPRCLVGILKNGTLLPNEASIVLTRTNDDINEIFQIQKPLSLNQIRKISSLEKNDKIQYLRNLETIPILNPKAADIIKKSDCIIFGSGTPHSSLLPSLETKGAGYEISLLNCPKVLIVNLKKETNNYLGVTSLISDVIKFLNKSGETDFNPESLITHVLVATKSETEYHINPEIDEIKAQYPWLKVIEGEFYDTNDTERAKHDGIKVLNAIHEICT